MGRQIAQKQSDRYSCPGPCPRWYLDMDNIVRETEALRTSSGSLVLDLSRLAFFTGVREHLFYTFWFLLARSWHSIRRRLMTVGFRVPGSRNKEMHACIHNRYGTASVERELQEKYGMFMSCWAIEVFSVLLSVSFAFHKSIFPKGTETVAVASFCSAIKTCICHSVMWKGRKESNHGCWLIRFFLSLSYLMRSRSKQNK